MTASSPRSISTDCGELEADRECGARSSSHPSRVRGTLPDPGRKRLRVLIVAADPATSVYPALGHLQAELRAVRRLFELGQGSQLEATHLLHATPRGLQRMLHELRPDLCHFIGHAAEGLRGPSLILEGAVNDDAHPVAGAKVASWLAEAGVSLAVLSACTSAGDEESLAHCLVDAGVRTAIGMRDPLRDASAGPFMERFYSALLSGAAAAEALEQARTALPTVERDNPVLHGDGALGFEPVDAPTRCATDLLHLPDRSVELVGRDEWLARLDRHFRADPATPAVIVSLPGGGASALAVEFGHRSRALFPGGIFFLPAGGAHHAVDELASLAEHFSLDLTLPAAGKAHHVRERLRNASDRTLLILDGWDDGSTPADWPLEGVCRILATSGSIPPPTLFPERFHLDGLQPESGALLTGWSGGTARDISAFLGGNPVLLQAVRAHADALGYDVERCAAELRQTPIEAIRTAVERDPRAAPIRRLFGRRHALGDSARRMLHAATSLSSSDISEELLQECCAEAGAVDSEDALEDLIRMGLLRRNDAGRLRYEPLVRFLSRCILPDSEQTEVLAACARAVTRALLDANDRMEWHAVAADVAHAEELQQQLSRCPSPAADFALSLALAEFHHGSGGRKPDAAYCAERALARAEEVFGAMSLETARARCRAATIRFRRENPLPARTELRAARRMAQRVLPENDPRLAEFDLELGYVLRWQHRLGSAHRFYTRALQLAEAGFGPMDPLVATCLNNIGVLHEVAGELAEAAVRVARALEIDRAHFGEHCIKAAVRHNNLGRLLARQGRWQESLEQHRSALAIYRMHFDSDHTDVGMSQFYIADVLWELGSRADAVRRYREARESVVRVLPPHHPSRVRLFERLGIPDPRDSGSRC